MQTQAQKPSKKLLFLTSMGAALEYYDFIIYGMMIIFLSEIFFPAGNSSIAYLKTFSILSIGYIARPIGGYLFGLIADIHGRKKTLLLVMLVMAFSTLMIGLLPTYTQAGVIAPLLLTLARILQGLSFGAEMPNMATVIQENTENGRGGKYFGVLMSSTAVGSLVASLALTLLNKCYNHEAIVTFAWRIPFLFGGLLALLVFILRSQMTETPAFQTSQQKAQLHTSLKNVSSTLFKSYWKSLIKGLSLTLFFSYLIIFSLYLPVYLKEYYHYDTKLIFGFISMSLLVSVFLSPFFGALFDKLNRVNALKKVTVAFLIFLALSLKLLHSQNQYALFFFLLFYQVFISMYSTNIFALLPTLFPLSIRATGMGVCYNTAYSIASLTPLILTPLVQVHNYQTVVMVFSSVVVGLTLLGSR